MRAHVYRTLEEAQLHLIALAGASVYARDGRPGLPRCDSGKWGDSEVRQGANCRAMCPCTSRSNPDDGCPYVTRRAADPITLEDGRVAVPIVEAHAVARGERVGAVTITDVGAVDLDEDSAGRWRPRAMLPVSEVLPLEGVLDGAAVKPRSEKGRGGR